MATTFPYRQKYPKTAIIGFEQVIANIEKKVNQLENVTTQGMIKAMAHIRTETMNTTPVDTGNMSASWFVVTNSGVAEGQNPKWANIRSRSKSKKARALKIKAEHPQVVNEMLAETKMDVAKINVIAGYSANYALFVHEMEMISHPDTSELLGLRKIKWLEKAFKKNSRKIFEIIKSNTLTALK